MEWVIRRADQATLEIEKGQRADSLLSQAAKAVQIPLDAAEGDYGAVLNCFRSAKPGHVSRGEENWLKHRLAAQANDQLRGYGYDCVPLLVNGRAIGVLVVDNQFKVPPAGDRVLQGEELRTLQAFAELAAMSIENRRLRERSRIVLYRAVVHQARSPILQAHRVMQTSAERPTSSDLDLLFRLVSRASRFASSSSLFADLAEGKQPEFTPWAHGLGLWITDQFLKAHNGEFALTEQGGLRPDAPRGRRAGLRPTSNLSERPSQ